MHRIIFLSKILIFSLLLYLEFGASKWLGNLLRSFDYGERIIELFEVIASFLLVAFGLNILIHMLSSGYRRRKKYPKNRMDNVLLGLHNIYLLLMTAAVLAAVLSLAGIDFKSLFTGLSIVAAAIAIITKDFITNIISGIAISFSNEFTIGDYIRIGDNKGKVTDITLSKVSLLTDDDDVVFIPNSFFFADQIINHSKKGKRTVNIEFEVSLASLDTVEELEADLIQSLNEYLEFIEAESFRLRIMDIQKDSLSFKFQYVLKGIDRDLEREIKRKTIRRVVNHIRQERQ